MSEVRNEDNGRKLADCQADSAGDQRRRAIYEMGCRSAVVGTEEEVAVACQLPETFAFPRGRSLDELPPQPAKQPIKAKTAQNAPCHRHAAILIRPKIPGA